MKSKQSILLSSCLILLLSQPSSSQYYQHDEPISTSSSVFTDPIRRALGLWGRLLNRMAQTSPPTDDQLHLTKTNEEVPEQIQEVPLNPARIQGIQQQESFSNLAGKSSGVGSANSIIDEQKLLDLLPRVRNPSTTTTTTVEIPSTTTTNVVITKTTPSLTTTVTQTPTNPQKVKKKGKKKTLSTKNIAKTTTTRASTTPKPKPSHTVSQSNITSKTLTVRMRTLDTLFNSENTTFEDVLIKNSNISMDKAMEKETEDLISEIESVLNDEQWIVAGSSNHKGVTNKTEKPSSTTTIATSPTSSGFDRLDEDGSGESSEEKSEESSEEDEETEISATVKSAESNDSLKVTSTVPTTTTTSKPKTTRKATTTTVTPTTFSITTTTPKPKKIRNPSKKKTIGNISSNVTRYIPEAEEEEIAGDIAQLQLDSSTALPNSQNVFNVNSNANSNSNPNLASVITPVNSIIDGIGPLILPLIGYSRQAISQYYPRRLEGTPTYRPENQQEIPLGPAQPQEPSAQQEQQSQQYSTPRRQYGQPNRPQLPQYPPLRPQPTMSTVEAKHLAEMMQRRSQQNQLNQQNQQSRNFKHFSEINRMIGVAPTPNLSNRIVNAETVGTGPRSRFMPNPPTSTPSTSSLIQQMQQQTPMPTIFASDAIRRALANILSRAGESPIVRQISGSNVAETPYYPPEIPQHSRYGENVVRESYNGFQSTATAVDPDKLAIPLSSSMKPATTKPKLKEADPGYDKGRSEVESTFYSDSGIMVQEPSSSNKRKIPSPEESGNGLKSSSLGQSSGFGGGRRPDSPFF